MLLRASTFLVGVLNAASGSAEARWQMGANAIQVYAPGGMFWSSKSLILRNAPYTINNPHLGQIEVRTRFGEIARSHKGAKGFIEGLPAIAYYIKKELTGFKAPDAMTPEDYPSKKQRTKHTLESLKRLGREKMKKARAPTVPPPTAFA